MKEREFGKYRHHGNVVWTRLSTKGKHRDMCLCYSCKKFKMDLDEKCKIADDVYQNCIKHGLVTPVFECPLFEEES